MTHKVIFKYRINSPETIVRLPADHKVLWVGNQNGDLYAWIMIDTSKPLTRSITFAVVSTGEPIDRKLLEEFNYCGTVPQPPYVWHVFHNGIKP